MRTGPAAVAVALVLTLLAGMASASAMRFPGEQRELPGTPYRLLVQPGVPAEQVALVERGLRATHARLGGRRPVEVRLAADGGCRPGPRAVPSGPAWAEPGLVCLDAGAPAWRAAVVRDAWYPAFASAHEAVHAWQAELGCYAPRQRLRYLWLFEGMAEHLALDSLVAAGLVPIGAAQRRVAELRGLRPELGGLERYERPGAGSPAAAYPLFQVAASWLQDQAGRHAFGAFCRDVGRGTPWREAFALAFGCRPEDVYDVLDGLRRERYVPVSLPAG